LAFLGVWRKVAEGIFLRRTSAGLPGDLVNTASYIGKRRRAVVERSRKTSGGKGKKEKCCSCGRKKPYFAAEGRLRCRGK